MRVLVGFGLDPWKKLRLPQHEVVPGQLLGTMGLKRECGGFEDEDAMARVVIDVI
jgi:hypothetical protein